MPRLSETESAFRTHSPVAPAQAASCRTTVLTRCGGVGMIIRSAGAPPRRRDENSSMKTPLLVVVVRQGRVSDSESYVAVLRETFLGPQSSAVPSVHRAIAGYRVQVRLLR
jgi:hypothetical protein